MATKKKSYGLEEWLVESDQKKKSPALDCVNFRKSHVLKLNYARDVRLKGNQKEIAALGYLKDELGTINLIENDYEFFVWLWGTIDIETLGFVINSIHRVPVKQ